MHEKCKISYRNFASLGKQKKKKLVTASVWEEGDLNWLCEGKSKITGDVDVKTFHSYFSFPHVKTFSKCQNGTRTYPKPCRVSDV